MMRLEVDPGELKQGLEIGILGYESNPTDALDTPTQLFIELYEGRLQVHLWTGKSEDPTTFVLLGVGKNKQNDNA